MEVGVEKWWNGAMAAEEDTKLASEPGLGMKSPSTEVEAPAMASIEDRTWQSPNILPFPFVRRGGGPVDLIRSYSISTHRCRGKQLAPLLVDLPVCYGPNRSKAAIKNGGEQ
jgi:hypothetical protein